MTVEASADGQVSVADAIDPSVVQRVSAINDRIKVYNLQSNADPAAVTAQLQQMPGT